MFWIPDASPTRTVPTFISRGSSDTSISPLDVGKTPAIADNNVDFPDPFRPIKPTASPWKTSIETPLIARTTDFFRAFRLNVSVLNPSCGLVNPSKSISTFLTRTASFLVAVNSRPPVAMFCRCKEFQTGQCEDTDRRDHQNDIESLHSFCPSHEDPPVKIEDPNQRVARQN